MNKLIAFGDSFTWGSDLDDALDGALFDDDDYDTYKKHHHTNGRKIGQFSEIDHNHKITSWQACYSRKTWTALLAKKLNLEYVCYAEPGCSNQSITRQFFQYLPYISKDDIVVINWTWIDRWEVFNGHDETSKQWVVLRPSGSDDKKLNDFYFKYLQSEIWNKLETLKMILLLINTLKVKQIKFLMTSVDKLVVDEKFHSPSYITALREEVTNDITWFNGDGFLDWSKKNNFPIDDVGKHPLDKAHVHACEYIMENHDFT
jgi:hypothetical protein